jgi:hypothetical protein
MNVREILQNLAENGNPVLEKDDKTVAAAGVHLSTLPEMILKRNAHLQPDMYIAEISDGGYLGRVLFRFKKN